MNRTQTLHPNEDETSFFFLSDQGEIVYKPVGYDTEKSTFTLSVDDSRLPRTSTIHTSSTRSQSLPFEPNIPDPDSPAQTSLPIDDELAEEARLGLPEQWMIFPLTKGAASTSNTHHRNDKNIDFSKFDYSRPFEFSLSVQSQDPLPAYHSRSNSITDNPSQTLPPYPIDEDLSSVVQAIYLSNPTLKPPKYKRARPLPHDFSPQELLEIRRKTRHRIRVITRNSLGLTVTLGLSCVAPQMLIAAAINGFCLCRGAYKLHQHLNFLKWNNLHVQKRDVAVAVIEGVVIKLVFLAVTVNHDDFLVLTHELVSSHSDAVAGMLHELPGFDHAAGALHELPGFDHANHFFLAPIEKVQQLLDLPSMAERAAGHLAFGTGGWMDPANEVLKNMFFVGAVQSVMESAIDKLQDNLGRVGGKVSERVRRERRKRKGEEMGWTRNRELMFRSGDKFEKGYFKH